MKKFLTTILAGLLLFSLAACGGSDAVEPVYTSDEVLDIGMWVGVSDYYVIYDEFDEPTGAKEYLSEEQFMAEYVKIAESGINIAFPGYEYMHDGSNGYNMKCLKAAQAAGIRQIIAISSLKSNLMSAKTRLEAGLVTREALVEEVRNALKPYTESEYADALYGVLIQDEPDGSKYDALGFAEEIFAEAAPDLMFYVNLFPVIATGAQLGGANPISYETYISQYLEKIKTDYLSYDHYPLYKSGKTTSLEASFLQNMEIIRNKIDEEGEDRDMWTFLQSIQFGSKNRELESAADATFQMYSFLAYGGDGVQWFCYACPPPNDGSAYFGNNALIDREYNKTDTYGYVQTANRYAQALMPYYKNFKWKGVMTTSADGGEGNFERINPIAGTDTLKAVTGTEDALVGVFADKDGRDGYMVVNFTDPGKNKACSVTLKVKGATNAIVVKNGEKTAAKVKKGKITLDLASGEGCFVIPY